MHKTLTLKVHLNKVSDGTDTGIIINKVHGLLQNDLAPHGFVGVQLVEPEDYTAPDATAEKQEAATDEAAELEKPKKKSK